MDISSQRDENHVPALIVTRSDDGYSPMHVYISPSTHRVFMQDGVGGNGPSSINAERDANHVPVLMAVSSEDFTTPVPVWGDFNTGTILIKSS